MVGVLVQSPVLESYRQANSPESHKQAHSPESHKQAHSPESHKQAHSPESHKQAHSPESHKQAHSPESHKQAHSLESHKQAQSLESHKQTHSLESHRQAHSPESHKQAWKGSHWLRNFVAGGVAGCCAKCTIAPLDRVKILLQAQNRHYRHLGVFSTLVEVPRKEGFLGLYKGNGAMMLRIFPYGAIQFTSFEKYRKFLNVQMGFTSSAHRLLAGSMAGITAVLCTYPLDMVRARLAFQVKGDHVYEGILHAFRVIYRQEGGFKGFYHGLTPTVIGMTPYAGVSFFTFGSLKSFGLSYAPGLLGKPSGDNPNVLVLKTPINLMCGGIAGAFAQTISYPLDVARRRMQLSTLLPNSENFVSLWQTLQTVYRQDGVKRGLYRGLTLNYIRCIPSQAVAFTVYEIMRQLLHLN